MCGPSWVYNNHAYIFHGYWPFCSFWQYFRSFFVLCARLTTHRNVSNQLNYNLVWRVYSLRLWEMQCHFSKFEYACRWLHNMTVLYSLHSSGHPGACTLDDIHIVGCFVMLHWDSTLYRNKYRFVFDVRCAYLVVWLHVYCFKFFSMHKGWQTCVLIVSSVSL